MLATRRISELTQAKYFIWYIAIQLVHTILLIREEKGKRKAFINIDNIVSFEDFSVLPDISNAFRKISQKSLLINHDKSLS